ncbi:MAG TPA: NDP-hexose 2,3-dehydratase family protein, partial [Phnomibacter sp.]|nr:NDP-hexose 2,3-dehydratase family protein [Phnomibacter sp.]
QVHQGRQPAYLEYFRERRGQVLVDQLQSEQGARFFRKRNRNIIIEVEDDLPAHEDFRWLTLGQLKALLKEDNVVNMDTRTVISAIGYGSYEAAPIKMMKLFTPAVLQGFHQLLFYSYVQQGPALHSFAHLLSWLTELKSSYELEVSLMPLKEVQSWHRDAYRIYHEEGRYFEVMGVEVSICNREVTRWSQPIVKPCQEGIVAFIAKTINGVLHFLVQAKLEVGNLDIVELAPTVQCITGNYRKGLNEYDVPYLDYVLQAAPAQRMFDVLLSEEGGRFYKNQNRNLVVWAPDDYPLEELPNYSWMTLHQLMQFMQYNNYLNIEARSLLSVLSFR